MRFYDLTDPRELRKLELQREATKLLRADTRRRNRMRNPPAAKRKPAELEPPARAGWYRGLDALRLMRK